MHQQSAINYRLPPVDFSANEFSLASTSFSVSGEQDIAPAIPAKKHSVDIELLFQRRLQMQLDDEY